MPASQQKKEYIARTNFSVGTVTRDPSGVERTAKLYKRGDRVPLTAEQYEQNKRFVFLPVEGETPMPMPRDMTAREIVGHMDVPTREMVDAALKQTGALPITDKSSVIGQITDQAEATSPQPNPAI